MVWIQAALQKLLDYWVPVVAHIVLANVLMVPVESPLSDVLLDLLGILSVKGISLGDEVVKAAAKGPDVHLRVQAVLWAILEYFRCRVIQMAAKALILEQLLEVVRHADQVELDQRIAQVNSRRMDVSEDESLLVDMADAGAELSEYGDDLV